MNFSIQVEDKRPEEFMKLNFARDSQNIKAKLRLLVFMTGNEIIFYMPSLNLSAYGDNEAEAKAMMEVVVEDYFSHLCKLNIHQAMQEIKQYGWIRKPYLPKQLKNIQFIDEKTIKENFDLPAETVISEKFVSV